MGLDDLTITSQRSQVVDFSVPYQTSTLQILIKVSVLKNRQIALVISNGAWSTGQF